MRARGIFFWVLCSVVVCAADSPSSSPYSPAQYRAELDRLLNVTAQLHSGSSTPDALHHLPQDWQVEIDQHQYAISTEGLQRDVRRYDADQTPDNAASIRQRIESLRAEVDGFEKPVRDRSAERASLAAILARPEFRDVHGLTWLQRFQQKMLRYLIRLLSKIFGTVAVPVVGKFLVYSLIAIAALALLYFVYRLLVADRRMETVVPRDLPVSAKEWAVWLAEARTAAAKGEWRDAIHLAYWAGISFLERQGYWKPDRARTPREYLRLMTTTGDQRDTLTTLTRIFEMAWYAKRDADESAFSRTLEQLEKLGCR